MRVSQSVIAKNLGLTQQAVSGALRGAPNISERVRALVDAEARRLGYRTNKLAQSLALGRSGFVGLLLPTFSMPYFTTLFDAIEWELTRRGLQMIAKRWNRFGESDAEDIDMMLQYNVEGLIASPRGNVPWEHSIYAELAAKGMKMAFLTRQVPLPGVSNVMADELTGASLAIGHLLHKGHRHIAYVGVGEEPRRHEGYRASMAKAGLEARSFIVGANGVDGVADWLAKHPDITALFCESDMFAVELISKLRQLGLSVPDDLSVVGFGDNLFYPDEMSVPLTTVSQCAETLGVKAVEALSRLIDGQGAADIEVPTKLVARKSVKDLNPKKHAF